MDQITEDQLNSWFYFGKYKDVVSTLGRAPLVFDGQPKESHSIIQIGALVFLGETDEANRLYKKAAKAGCTQHFHICCRFYLAIGETRRSSYAQAASLLAKNLNELRRTPNVRGEVTGFYITQGIAFFRFYKCQFNASAKYAEQAYLNAFENDFLYGQALALDALGQSLCFLGKIRRGLHEIERAHGICVRLGNGGFAAAIKLTLLRFKAQYGIMGKTAVSELRKALNQIDAQNDYSRCAIFLELARQLILRGCASEAQSVLNEAGDTVYKHQNKRQLARYNHRQAYLLFLRGQGHAALALLRSAVLNLNPQMDLAYFAEYRGLEARISGQVSAQKLQIFSSYLDERISRRTQADPHSFLSGEDPLGDFLDEVRREGVASLSKIQESGLWGLVPVALRLRSDENFIYLGPIRGAMILNSFGDVVFARDKLTASMKKLILEFSGGAFISKEALIRKVWAYEYDPSIHDRLLHATISRLRKVLGNHSHWIEWSSEGYRLSPQVKVYQGRFKSNLRKTEDVEPTLASRAPVSSELNHRQVVALRQMCQGQMFGVREYARRFRVSVVTACRDLTWLYQDGQIIRFGRARATRYGRAPEQQRN